MRVRRERGGVVSGIEAMDDDRREGDRKFIRAGGPLNIATVLNHPRALMEAIFKQKHIRKRILRHC